MLNMSRQAPPEYGNAQAIQQGQFQQVFGTGNLDDFRQIFILGATLGFQIFLSVSEINHVRMYCCYH